MGERGGYYEEAGALRDMVQNHMLQVLSLDRDGTARVARSRVHPRRKGEAAQIHPPADARGRGANRSCAANTSPARWTASRVPGYRQEPKVKPDSNVETYVALKLFIDNWRWSGVPFYLRTGKYLPHERQRSADSIPPHAARAVRRAMRTKLDANALTLRLQPNEGISLRFNGKVPGMSLGVRPVRMHFSYDAEFGAYTPEAYERLLLEAIAGDATLFIRRDEVETAWQIVDSIRTRLGRQAADEPRILRRRHVGPGCRRRFARAKRPRLARAADDYLIFHGPANDAMSFHAKF